MVRFGVKISQSGYSFDEVVALCQKAESVGFESFWVADHMYSWGRKVTNETALECWSLLSALSGVTKRIRLGTLVTCPLFRSPPILAKISSTIDVISGGRLEFGIGLCGPSTPPELMGFGLGFPKRAERVQRLTETLEILKSMWTQEVTDYRGKYYTITGALNSPKPIQKPYPPVWIGGENEDMLALAVRYARGWNCRGFATEDFRDKVAALDTLCDAAGRERRNLVKSWQGGFLIGRNEVRLQEKRAKYRASKTRIDGTPEQVVDQLRRYVDLGATYFMFNFQDDHDDLSSLEVFADRVAPNFERG